MAMKTAMNMTTPMAKGGLVDNAFLEKHNLVPRRKA